MDHAALTRRSDHFESAPVAKLTLDKSRNTTCPRVEDLRSVPGARRARVTPEVHLVPPHASDNLQVARRIIVTLDERNRINEPPSFGKHRSSLPRQMRVIVITPIVGNTTVNEWHYEFKIASGPKPTL